MKKEKQVVRIEIGVYSDDKDSSSLYVGGEFWVDDDADVEALALANLELDYIKRMIVENYGEAEPFIDMSKGDGEK